MKVNVKNVATRTAGKTLEGIFGPDDVEIASAEEGSNDKGAFINCTVMVQGKKTFVYFNAPTGEEKSLEAFKELATDMGYTADADGEIDVNATNIVGRSAYVQIKAPKDGQKFGKAYFITASRAKWLQSTRANGAVGGTSSLPGTISTSTNGAIAGLASSL